MKYTIDQRIVDGTHYTKTADLVRILTWTTEDWREFATQRPHDGHLLDACAERVEQLTDALTVEAIGMLTGNMEAF